MESKKNFNSGFFTRSASWSRGNVFVSGAGGQKFKSRDGQIGHSVANGFDLPQPKFTVFDLPQPKIEPDFTISFADTLPIRPLIGLQIYEPL